MAGLTRKYVNWFARKTWGIDLGRIQLLEHKNCYLIEVLHGFDAQVLLVRSIATNKYPYIEVSDTSSYIRGAKTPNLHRISSTNMASNSTAEIKQR